MGKKAIIGAAAAVLVLAAVAVAAVVVVRNHGAAAAPANAGPKATSKSIQDICQPTDYRATCESALTKAAGNVSDPRELTKLAFNITVAAIESAFNHSQVLSAAAKDPRTSDALNDCRELFNYAVSDLKHSFEQISSLDSASIAVAIDDLKTWLSAVITYQETCIDGFEGTNNTAAGASMQKALNSSMELSSNVLAIIDSFADVLSSFQIQMPFGNRRLLSDEDGFPEWLSDGKRRLLQTDVSQMKPDVVVAKDGSGKYRTIREALSVVPKNSKAPFIIYVKAGVYQEKVQINSTMPNVVMIGDGPTKTKVSGSLNFIDGTATFQTAPFAVIGDGFVAKNMGFENTAGPDKHQAVALRVQSDRSVFYNCRMDGYQDTLYVHSKRQFYRDCTITGTIDFIFGDGGAVLQNCLILARKPLANQQNIVTAQGRKDKHQNSAILLHNCTISADPSLEPVKDKFATYLGRPWKEYSRTFIVQSQLDDVINSDGWLPWLGDFGLNTCFYTEVDNRGPGSDKSKRVKWKGVKNVPFAHAMQYYTVETFIQGNQWLPSTGVPFIPGLLPQTESGRIH